MTPIDIGVTVSGLGNACRIGRARTLPVRVRTVAMEAHRAITKKNAKSEKTASPAVQKVAKKWQST